LELPMRIRYPHRLLAAILAAILPATVLSMAFGSGLGSPTPAVTSVGGVLPGSTVWTEAMSPVVLKGPLLVPQGTSLKIEPGVEVQFNGYFLRVEGELRAIGAADKRVRFTGKSGEVGEPALQFMASSTDWDPVTGAGSTLKYVTTTVVTSSALIHIQDTSPFISHRRSRLCAP